jgi:thiaminase/transcriptional activator TenA
VAIEHEFYGEWIKGYASKEYAKGNIVLLDMLSSLTKHYTQQQIKHLVDIFIACSRYELAFWEMSWNMRK